MALNVTDSTVVPAFYNQPLNQKKCIKLDMILKLKDIIYTENLEEDILTSQTHAFETTDDSATPSGLVYCELSRLSHDRIGQMTGDSRWWAGSRGLGSSSGLKFVA